MIRTMIGVIVASIVIYAWGFVYWGMGPYPTLIWKQAADQEGAGSALREHFPDRGTYFVPGRAEGEAAEDHASRFERGPVAFVHMLHPEGRAQFDPTIMGQGFVLNLVVVVLVAVLLHNVGVSNYVGRVGLVALAGIAASVLIDGGDIVWWQIPWEWKLYQAAYNVSVWVIAGVVLAAFIRPHGAAPTATTNT